MRIQHNIAAMNAYRNYNTNTSAVSKNLEKLSSGYKINRAGDDAAGLAISEKMRAQISGLEAASKNVKDGISLVKTAEGAMQEVQDMLNRMVTLATQSANGTYDNEVDRLNLQKEVDQLKSEINRIADSSNFNGIKLLDGSQEIKTSFNMASPTEKETGADAIFNIVADGQLGVDAQAGVFSFDLSQLTVKTDNTTSVDNAKIVKNAASGELALTERVGDDTTTTTPASYKMDLSNLTLQDGADDGTLVFTVGDKEYDVDYTAGDTVSAVIANFITAFNADALTDAGGNDLTASAITDSNGNNIGVTFTADASTLVDETGSASGLQDGDTNAVTFSVSERTDVSGMQPDSVAITEDTAGTTTATAVYSLTLDGMTADQTGTVTFTIGGKDYNVDVEEGEEAESIAAKLVDAFNADPVEDDDVGAYTAAVDGTDATKITLTAATAGVVDTDLSTGTLGIKGATKELNGVAYELELGGNKFSIQLDANTNYSGADLASKIADVLNGKSPDAYGVTKDYSVGGVSFTATANSGVLTITMDEAPKEWDAASADNLTMQFHHTTGATNNGGEQFKARVDIEPIDSSRERQYAQATLDLNQLNIKDGTTIQLGDTTYTFAIGSDSRFKNASNIIDLTDKTQDEFTAKADGKVAAGVQAAANRLSKVAASNATFYVGSDTNGVISLTEKEGAVDYAVNNLAGKENDGTAGLPEADANQKNDVTATANDWKGLVKYGQASISGSGLTLQIGDTSDEYNQLVVSIGDIHTKALGIDNIDISTQSGAQSAIDTIKTAINSVSSIRGTLGATQNRLEHTANNLSVMTENIQDAESTIRDTDIAEEMMAYTKNNILVQSAQAMLAQANQIPQGVLQLLG